MAVFGIYIAIFMLIFNGAWLWFCYVYVTGDHSKSSSSGGLSAVSLRLLHVGSHSNLMNRPLIGV